MCKYSKFETPHKTRPAPANWQFSKIISRLANGKVYIYTLANCQVGDFTILTFKKVIFILTQFDRTRLLFLQL